MQEQLNSRDAHLVGDKVRVRSGPHTGARGTLQKEAEGLLEIQLEAGDVVHLASEAITNYSRAARRAWQVMPKKAGRPALPARKKMVSMRIDEELWDRLGEAVDLGLIPSREQAINIWIREQLDILFRKQIPSDADQE